MDLLNDIAGAAAAQGHYSQAVAHGGMLFLATQLGFDPRDPAAPPGSIEDQARNALASVAAILVAAGSGLDQIIKVTIYLSDIAHWDAVNAVYGEVLGPHRPARGVIPAGKLHRGYDVAIDVIAALPDRERER